MKTLYIVISFLFCFQLKAKADHITGGEMYYTFLGASNDQYKYRVTLKLFMVCSTFREFNNPTYISIFNKATNVRIRDVVVNLRRTERLSLSNENPCITNPPTVCFRVGFYEADIVLPASAQGYVISSQAIFRIDGMKNLVEGYDQIGATYTTEIPGTSNVATAPENNSAVFTGSDLVVVCSNNSFSYSFAAQDVDGDVLKYTFCNAYQGGSFSRGGEASPAPNPPYSSVPYGEVFSGAKPLGNDVIVNPNTGLITGIAPSPGVYVITVCVTEMRNGVAIATQRKDVQINITSCSIAAATIPSEFILCGDDSTIQVSNYSTSPLIKTYDWHFINSKNQTLYTSKDATAQYRFTDTGLYKVRLVINRNEECADSATATIRVYPGFDANMEHDGNCIGKPTQFSDLTTSTYGIVNFRQWDFGEAIGPTDQSDLPNPSYKYNTAGPKTVQLIVADTKGCTDTVSTTILIDEKPPVPLGFKDTLICKGDKLQMVVNGSGDFEWTPKDNMSDANTSTPTVSPTATTVYYVEMNDNGCINADSVVVNVTDKVDIQPLNDTTICSGDAIMFNLTSNALSYVWSPADQLDNATIQNPVATPNTTTKYEVIASIGSCTVTEDILVKTAPYPLADAGNDTTVCYNTAAHLNGVTTGNSFIWSSSNGVTDSASLNTRIIPSQTTTYTLYAYDTQGCPKPGIDTVVVRMLPPITPDAGSDTSVVINQPLQLSATGGTVYTWSPSIGLSATNIANPVAVFSAPFENLQYKVLVSNEAGCTDSAFLNIKVYKTLPSVFVPTAFTPNKDGLNDVLKPIAAGMQRVELFTIYNRWGQLIYRSTTHEAGWDGTNNGIAQKPDTYVWMVKAIDYSGNPYFKKGTVTLIR